VSKATYILLSLKAPAVLSNDQITELKESWLAAQGKAEDATKENYLLRAKLAKANERAATLEQCVIKFRQGVTHFNRTRGDLNVLLSAYADCEQLRTEQVHG